MTEITASLVKQLRDQTGVGMMDCKKALAETKGRVDEAVEWLRKKGLASASKKAGRAANEGVVVTAGADDLFALVEINTETDFVARNDVFQDFARIVAQLALTVGNSLDALLATAWPGGKADVATSLVELIASMGENIAIRRMVQIKPSSGICASYTHGALAEGMGRIGVLVALETSEKQNPLVLQTGRSIAMHIAAAAPRFLDRDSADPQQIEAESRILRAQAEESGRTGDIIEKMVTGRLRKFFAEYALLEQIYVVDSERTIAKLIEDLGKEINAPVEISSFARFALGETGQ